MNVVRRIAVGEAELYRRLRLAALQDSPFAFTTTDAAALARTEESWQQQADEAANGEDRAIFIAHCHNEAAGLAALYRDRSQPHIGELLQVWVSPVFRGQQVARQLIDAATDWARQRQFQTIKALVATDSALSFYRKCELTRITADPQWPEHEFTLEL